MDNEIEMYLAALEESLDTVAATLEGLDDTAILWRPSAGANSLAVIMKHCQANATRNVMSSFLGEPYEYDRPEEFRDTETLADLLSAWTELRQRMRAALEKAPAELLAAPRQHVRMGTVPGRAVLLQVCRHAAEHAGEARLTRQLLDAQASRPEA